MNYRRNRRYFATLDWILMAVLVIISIALFYLYSSLKLKLLIVLGIVIVLGIALIIFLKYFDRPTDEDIDATYQEEADIAIRKGYEKLGLDPDTVLMLDPIVIHGPMVNKIRYAPAIRRGRDNKVRSSNYEMIVLFFSELQVYFYHQQFSIIDDESIETTDEYFYDDIVSISIASTSTTYYTGRYRREDHFKHKTFKLVTEGRSVECAILNDKMIASEVAQMRDLLREKKGVTEHI